MGMCFDASTIMLDILSSNLAMLGEILIVEPGFIHMAFLIKTLIFSAAISIDP